MNAAETSAQFETWYEENTFDYEKNAIGSRECSLMWKAWQAALAVRQSVEPSRPDVEILANALGYFHNAALGHVADASHHGPASGYDVVAAIAVGLGAVATGLRESAQPAPAVDLGAMRKCAADALEFISHGYDGHARGKVSELLALIDSHQTG